MTYIRTKPKEMGPGRGKLRDRPWGMYPTDKWIPRVNFSGPIDLMCDDGRIRRIEPDPKNGVAVREVPPSEQGEPPTLAAWHSDKVRPRTNRHTHSAYTGYHITKAKEAVRKQMLEDLKHGRHRSDDEYLAVAEAADPLVFVATVRHFLPKERAFTAKWFERHGTLTKEEVDRGKRGCKA